MTNTDPEYVQLKQKIREAVIEVIQENRDQLVDMLAKSVREVVFGKGKIDVAAKKRRRRKAGRKPLKDNE